ncbi:MAG: four helix bundle protein [bacterium]|nr:four helix bundle protein [bacterium]
MEQFRFRNWKVYRDAQELFCVVLSVVRKLPKEFRFEIGSQIIRSALSILLNIAEGSGKSSDKEMNRFLEISLGSVYETLAAIDALEYNGFITKTECEKVERLLASISRQLGGLKKRLDS